MSVSFAQKDNELVERIKKYQKENDLKSFAEAVRILCNSALDIKELAKKLK